ncbi:hypothetical protein [Anaerovirgula multivorans]|uniref:hypothetical protein n=1 Tax=Anaerovirgula multivorans TaxID=312168 RepID=UPI001595A721|nr:hypothetical protein [Anaerovirgula multivorans]
MTKETKGKPRGRGFWSRDSTPYKALGLIQKLNKIRLDLQRKGFNTRNPIKKLLPQ